MKFHLVILASIIPSLQQGAWYAAINLTDAYFHIATHPNHRKIVRFVVNSQHCQLTVLLFSLTSVLPIFTKGMAVVPANLRKLDVHVFPYLDDWLISLRSSISITLSIFNILGLLVNREKLILRPVQTVEFMGAVLDSTKARIFMPQIRFETIQCPVLQMKIYRSQ